MGESPIQGKILKVVRLDAQGNYLPGSEMIIGGDSVEINVIPDRRYDAADWDDVAFPGLTRWSGEITIVNRNRYILGLIFGYPLPRVIWFGGVQRFPETEEL